MKKILGIVILLSVFILPVYAALPGYPDGVNYATNKETQDFGSFQFYYDGYVQVTPSYRYNGKHALQGSFTYTLPGNNIKKFYTDLASGSSQSGVLSRSARVYDDYLNFTEKTKFNYGFAWAAPGVVTRSLTFTEYSE